MVIVRSPDKKFFEEHSRSISFNGAAHPSYQATPQHNMRVRVRTLDPLRSQQVMKQCESWCARGPTIALIVRARASHFAGNQHVKMSDVTSPSSAFVPRIESDAAKSSRRFPLRRLDIAVAVCGAVGAAAATGRKSRRKLLTTSQIRGGAQHRMPPSGSGGTRLAQRAVGFPPQLKEE
jgi:hypothetical protein